MVRSSTKLLFTVLEVPFKQRQGCVHTLLLMDHILFPNSLVFYHILIGFDKPAFRFFAWCLKILLIEHQRLKVRLVDPAATSDRELLVKLNCIFVNQVYLRHGCVQIHSTHRLDILHRCIVCELGAIDLLMGPTVSTILSCLVADLMMALHMQTIVCRLA